MKRNSYPLYALIAAGVVGLALWAGMPAVYLLVLACPAMMFFMMRGMNSGQTQRPTEDVKHDHSTPRSPNPSDRSN